MAEQQRLVVYGAPWCVDCRRSKQLLDTLQVDYDWIDIDNDAEAVQRVRSLNNGMNSIPTIVFPDGSFVTEPSNKELTEKLEAFGLKGN